MSGQPSIKTYPPAGECGIWLAALRIPFFIDAPMRPYCYIGRGTTEQAAIDHLKALEAADTWSPENANTKLADTQRPSL